MPNKFIVNAIIARFWCVCDVGKILFFRYLKESSEFYVNVCTEFGPVAICV